jgi:hypothetical protein
MSVMAKALQARLSQTRCMFVVDRTTKRNIKFGQTEL